MTRMATDKTGGSVSSSSVASVQSVVLSEHEAGNRSPGAFLLFKRPLVTNDERAPLRKGGRLLAGHDQISHTSFPNAPDLALYQMRVCPAGNRLGSCELQPEAFAERFEPSTLRRGDWICGAAWRTLE